MKLTDEIGKEYEFIVHGHHDESVSGKLTPIKPKSKRIDMSVCIESGILCDVNVLNPGYGAAKSFLAFYNPQINVRVEREEYTAEPLMNGHIHASPKGWDECPIPEGFVITFWGRDGGKLEGAIRLCYLGWHDITMFEVTGIAEGYTL